MKSKEKVVAVYAQPLIALSLLEPVPVFDASTAGTDGFGPVRFGSWSLPVLGWVRTGWPVDGGLVPGCSTASTGLPSAQKECVPVGTSHGAIDAESLPLDRCFWQ
jgi:hypothetical protein